MKMTRLLSMAAMWGLVVMMSCIRLFAQSQKAVVRVMRMDDGGKIVYKYSVKNCWDKPIWMMDLGRRVPGDPTLDAEPVKIASPVSWGGISSWLEDSSPERYCIVWKQPEHIGLIQPGETKIGFIAILGKASKTYENCEFTVTFVGGSEYCDKVTPEPKASAVVR